MDSIKFHVATLLIVSHLAISWPLALAEVQQNEMSAFQSNQSGLLCKSSKQQTLTDHSYLKQDNNATISPHQLKTADKLKQAHEATEVPLAQSTGNTQSEQQTTGITPSKFRLQKDIFTKEQLESIEKFLYATDELNLKYSLQEVGLMALTAKFHAYVYSDMFIHKYDNFEELKISGGPEVDQELCIKQLTHMTERAREYARNKYQSRDMNMIFVLETYGRIPPGMFVGDSIWPGLYNECLRLKIETPNGEHWPTRYCMASLKHPAWQEQQSVFSDMTNIKTAVCVPKSCDSQRYKNKYELIHDLIQFHFREADQGQSNFTGLYCLPDEESTITSWYHSPKAVLTVVLLASWILIQVYATIKYEQILKCKRQQGTLQTNSVKGNQTASGDQRARSSSVNAPAGFGLTSGFELGSGGGGGGSSASASSTKSFNALGGNKSVGETNGDNDPSEALTRTAATTEASDPDEGNKSHEANCCSQAESASTAGAIGKPSRLRMQIYRALSITNNLESLFNTTKGSSLLEVGEQMKDSRRASVSSANLDENELLKRREAEEEAAIRKRSFVDLRILEGIKVVCMSYVIMGHVLMCITTVLSNGREQSSSLSVSFFLANLVPAFAVNAFFTITGLLTSYLLFKQNQTQSFITSPIKWVAFIFYRYMRIMPMYLIVVLFTKTLAKYMGSGPFWDYGTSAIGQRHACEQESWLWTLLFGANFKSPLEHCIPSAWYLADDFQFFMVTPFFVVALYKNPAFGKQLLKLGMAAGFFAGVASIILSELDDLTPIARFMPHGFKTYVTFLHSNYTRPQYRIPAYLCGLYIGYMLYEYEQDKINYLIERLRGKRRETVALSSKRGESDKLDRIEEEEKKGDEKEGEPDWSEFFTKYGFALSIYFVFHCCITPLVGARIPFNKYWARILVALIMPSYHILFSLSTGMYISLATTGHGSVYLNRLLSASIWKIFARLSLCAVLINVEVVNYFIQTNTTTKYLDNQYQAALNLLCITSTYIVSIVICVLFEAPIRATLNHLLTFAVSRLAANSRASRKKHD